MKAFYRIYNKKTRSYYTKWQKSTWQKPQWVANRLQGELSYMIDELEVHIIPANSHETVSANQFIVNLRNKKNTGM